jgi:hypothetical protein
VDLAPLMGSPLEVPRYRRFEALVLVGDDQLDAREAPSLKRAENLLVGGSKLSVSATSTASISRKPSGSRTAETINTPWLTILWSILTFS